jgi:DNA-binding XRE family transcriptional regulator
MDLRATCGRDEDFQSIPVVFCTGCDTIRCRENLTEYPKGRTALATLKELRKQRGWTQQVLADKVGCVPSAIGNYESGIRAPSLATAFRIARILGTRLTEDLFPLTKTNSNGSNRIQKSASG